MQRIKSFGVLQTANITAIVSGVISVVILVPLFVWGYGGRALASRGRSVNLYDLVINVWFEILFPFVYAGIAWLATAIGCLIYNALARRFGGIELQLTLAPQEIQTAPDAPAPAGRW